MPPESLPLWCVQKNSSDHFIIKLKISSIWRSLIRARDTDSPRATDRALPLRIQTNTYKPTKLIPAKKLLTVCHTNIKHTNFFTTGDVFLSLCTSDLWVESHRSRIQQQKEWTMGYSSHNGDKHMNSIKFTAGISPTHIQCSKLLFSEQVTLVI